MADGKKFSKKLWLESANAQIERGTLTERERDDAIKIWVDDCDGKTKTELSAAGGECHLNDAWFE